MSFDVSRAVKFEKNLGENSQKNRYLIGGAILIVAMYYGYATLLFVALYLFGTAYSKWCPVMGGLGKNTTVNQGKLFFDVERMVKFEQNLGAQSQKNRYIAGGVLFLLCILTGYLILFPIALILVLTAYVKWCPIMSGLGKNTCSPAGA